MSRCGIFLNLVRTVVAQKKSHLNLTCFCSQIRVYSNKPPQPIIVEGISEIIEPKKPKRPIIPKITLLSGNDEVSVTTLEEAQKLSKRRDLKLVKLVDLDTKTQRPLYKLMTATEYHAEDVKSKKDKQKNTGFKGEKVVMLTSAIQEHDLQTHVKKISKWLAKQYEVRVIITSVGTNNERSDELYKIFEENLKADGRFIQKRTKGSELKFQIIPPKKEKDRAHSTNSNDNSGDNL